MTEPCAGAEDEVESLVQRATQHPFDLFGGAKSVEEKLVLWQLGVRVSDSA
jgi:hypothetical protein